MLAFCFCRTPVQRPKNIKKLKAFFGERTPKIVEAQNQALSGDAPTSPLADVSLEGTLTYKPVQIDRKVGGTPSFCPFSRKDANCVATNCLFLQKPSDRSWRTMWAVLRGHALFLHRDRASAVRIKPIMHHMT